MRRLEENVVSYAYTSIAFTSAYVSISAAIAAFKA
jgi:hypothetical protein